MDLEQLVLRIRVMADQADQSIDDVCDALGRMDAANTNSESIAKEGAARVIDAHRQQGAAAEASGVQAAAAYAGIAAVASQAFRSIVSGIEAGIDASNRYIAAQQGLQSVASGRGIGSEEMSAALDGITDKFFDATAAATSFKNLLSRGYSLDQATNTINALKNAAAYGRQASLTLASAVQSATEGIKNENSILVDNAGVTKNMAKMWEDYAAKLGVASTSLTTAQKIEAEYNGIMTETRFQMGDLASLSTTLAGAQAEAAMSGELLTRAYGESMAPAVEAGTALWNGFLGVVKDVVTAMPEATAGVTATGLAVTVLGGVLPAGAIALQTFGAQLTAAATKATLFGVAVNTAMPWLVGISVAIGAAVALYTTYTNAMAEEAKAAEEAAAAEKAHLQAIQGENTELDKLGPRYKELASKKRLSYSETKELASIEKTLEEQYGISVASLEGMTGAYDLVTAAIEEKIAANQKELQAQREIDAQNAKSAADTFTAAGTADSVRATAGYIKELQGAYDGLSDAEKNLKGYDLFTAYSKALEGVSDEAFRFSLQYSDELADDVAGTLEKLASDQKQALDTESGLYANWIKAEIAAMNGAIEHDAGTETIAQKMADLVWGYNAEEGFASSAGAQAAAEFVVESYKTALGSVDVSAAQEAASGFYKRVLGGESLTDTELASFEAAYKTLQAGVEQVAGVFGASEEEVQTTLGGIFTEMQGFEGNVTVWYQKLKEFDTAAFMTGEKSFDTKKYADAVAGAESVVDSYQDLAGEAANLQKSMDALQIMASLLQKGNATWTESEKTAFESAKSAAESAAGLRDDQLDSLQKVNDALASESAQMEYVAAREEALKTTYSDTAATLVGMRAALAGAFGESAPEVLALDNLLQKMKESVTSFISAASSSWSLSDGGGSGSEPAFDLWTSDAKAYQKQVNSVTAELKAMQTRIDKTNDTAGKVDGWKKIAQTFKDTKENGKEFDAMLVEAGLSANTTADQAIAAFDAMGGSLGTQTSDMQAKISGLKTYLATLETAAQVNGFVDIDTEAAWAGIISIAGGIDGLAEKLAALGWSNNNRGGGGGGTSKYQKDIDELDHLKNMEEVNYKQELAHLLDIQAKYTSKNGKSKLSLEDQRDLEERIYDAQEAIREEDLQNDYDALDHKKEMGELTLQQELETLRAIKAAHEMTADEIAEIDEKIYDVEQDIRDENADKLDAWADGIVDALEAKYDAMEEAELAHLEESRDNWDKWEEDNLAAVQSQIDALDELTKAEDREATDAAEQRKIDKLKEAVAYEQDAYNKAQLQRQLDEAEAAQAERLKDRERQDERDALEAQQDAIRDQADAEREAIDDEEDAVEAKYDDLTTDEALQAEAEAMLMAGNQEAILALMAEYAPDFNATGESLGEQWLDGFTGAISGSVSAWFDSLVTQLSNLQNSAATTAAKAVDTVATGTAARNSQGLDAATKDSEPAAGVNYYQTNNFNQPIETPADVTRALQRTAESLALEVVK